MEENSQPTPPHTHAKPKIKKGKYDKRAFDEMASNPASVTKQLIFARLYNGKLKETIALMREDGISMEDEEVSRLLASPVVKQALIQRAKAAGLTKEKLQAFWTDLMESDECSPSERLKASELAGKSIAAFTEKVEHSGGIALGVVDLLDNDILRAKRVTPADK